jgi:hypothetical protein
MKRLPLEIFLSQGNAQKIFRSVFIARITKPAKHPSNPSNPSSAVDFIAI